jgi:hypothetical protein
MMIKKLALGCLILITCVAGTNYFSLSLPADKVLKSDPRNTGISMRVHYGYLLNPSVLVLDLRQVSAEKSTADVFRVLFQIAEEFGPREFDKVYLASEGTEKFMLKGGYFKELGADFAYQNPMYLLRTLPQNVYLLSGDAAYSTWSGGWLGVSNKQMSDLNDLAQEWFIEDM